MPGFIQNVISARTAAAAGGTVAVDSVGPGATAAAIAGNNSILTWNHTLASVTDGYVLVAVVIGSASSIPTVLSVTCGVNTLAQITGATKLVGGTGHGRIEIWGVKNPTAGVAELVTVTLSGNVDAPTTGEIVGASLLLKNVNQTTPVNASNTITASGSGVTASTTVTSASNNLVIGLCSGGSAFSARQATDQSHNDANTNSGGGCMGGLSSTAGAASVALSWTLGSDSWAIIGLDFNHD